MAFKIIIIGGSVAGLSLALMLEKHGIDYILLEAYPEIAPQLGASIGLVPSGLRILDQLGCYEALRTVTGDPKKKTSVRDSSGLLLYSSETGGMAEFLEHETGYPALFLSRQQLLQVIYSKITHKDRIMAGKRLIRIDIGENGIPCVHTGDGFQVCGDIVVGADGVHSATRAEMWRLAAELAPGTFGDDEASNLQADARCIFGISKKPDIFPFCLQQTITGKGFSYMLISGHDHMLYWFMFESLPCRKPTRDLPRWTKEDEEALASKHFDDILSEKVTFRDVYENRMMTTLVTLEEHVFKRWHFNRIMTIGDSAHKVHPLAVLGGNGAIETAALFCNALSQRLSAHGCTLSDVEIEAAMQEVEDRQLKRATSIVVEGKVTQRWFNQQQPLASLMFRWALPFLGEAFLFSSTLKRVLQGARLKKLAVPSRPRRRPFDDERTQVTEVSWRLGLKGCTLLSIITLATTICIQVARRP